MNITMKTEDELKQLTDARLLNLLKVVRPKVRRYVNSFYCECCGDPRWVTHGKLYTDKEIEEMKIDTAQKINNAENYLVIIKKELSLRGHIDRTK